ncbi:hypothetical protein IMZ38_05750 [Thermosphaera chiliense]|uniref:Uncharacterized protein n=1 Tax=Thermosphaera chiliense TaxID=3402707 RepID=A0A7M1URJ1_9CREN|nr:hypothetical protein [Thermosphaera aggregans]QOR94137.1 hypothetical protein IMZ38_05750 [Thermosphaera aggregans]
MEMVFITLTFLPEEYRVKLEFYGENGRLVKTVEYDGVKQIVFKDVEVRVNRQLSQTPLVMIATAPSLDVSLVENSVLNVRGK